MVKYILESRITFIGNKYIVRFYDFFEFWIKVKDVFVTVQDMSYVREAWIEMNDQRKHPFIIYF